MPTYLVHVMEGRARLRHAALRDPATRGCAQAVLERENDVRAVQPGNGSLLLLLAENADVAAICQRLEAALPQLVTPTPAPNRKPSAGLPAGLGRLLPSCAKVSPRKLEVRAMFGMAGLCVVSGLVGGKVAHTLSGGLFALMAARHVWVRRKAL